jgi:hypothetical protein
MEKLPYGSLSRTLGTTQGRTINRVWVHSSSRIQNYTFSGSLNLKRGSHELEHVTIYEESIVVERNRIKNL